MLDDINWNLRIFPNIQESPFANYSDRELDTFQMKMVYDLLVRQHPDFDSFHLTNRGRMGWGRKKMKTTDKTSIGAFWQILRSFLHRV